MLFQVWRNVESSERHHQDNFLKNRLKVEDRVGRVWLSITEDTMACEGEFSWEVSMSERGGNVEAGLL